MGSLNKTRLNDQKPRIIIIFVLIALLIVSIQLNINGLSNNNKRIWQSPKISASVSKLWNFTTEGWLLSSPALGDVDADGTLEVVIGSTDGKVYVLNSEDGSELWNFTTGDYVESSPALGDVDGDGTLEVVIGSTDGKVYALNGEDGSEFWSFTTGFLVCSSPALGDVDDDDTLEVVVGSMDGKVYAINGEDGNELWNFTTLPAVYSSPALGDVNDDGTLEVVVGSYDYKVYALNGEDGSELWNFTTGYAVISSPALGDVDGDGTLEVVSGSEDKKVYALNGEDGSELWNFTAGDDVVSSPALGDMDGDSRLEVVIGSKDFKVYALNGEDGSELWNFSTESEVWSCPALGDVDGDGTLEVVVGSYDYKVYALNGEDGSELWNFTTEEAVRSSPALGDVDDDGTLEIVIGSGDRNVYALNPIASGERIYWNGLSGDTNFTRWKNQAFHDYDFDMLSNYSEAIYNTNPREPDSDFDLLNDIEEILGTLGYITNATDPDTDNDNLLDGYEYGNNTLPLNPDTDGDTLLDGDEILGSLGYVTNATNPDTDYDNLRDDYEYGNNTNPLLPDTDFDSFSDYVEINLGTNPTNRYWYPMPNLKISSFTVNDVYEGQPFVLDFTITNNGIWTAENVIVIIRCEILDLTLYNNTDSSFNLHVDESEHIVANCSEISKPGVYGLTLIIDPDNLINETYSSKDGGFYLEAEYDNSEQIQMQIIAKEGGTEPINIKLLLWIFLPIIIAFISIIVGVVIRRKYKKTKLVKDQELNAREDINEFEQKVQSFIRSKLKDFYKEEWWAEGIPQFIKNTVEPKVKSVLMKKPELSLDGMDFLDFGHYFPIISEKQNWDNIFSTTFLLVNNIKEPFENLKVFKNRLFQKQASMRDFAKYSMYIYAIEKYFVKEINIFLSYSTLDSDYFNIYEIAKSLEKYSEINKIFFWEVDSGEDIVDYMERTLKLSKAFILFCSENALKSQSVEDEWKAAFQLRKKGLMKIIPVYEDERFIPTLLTPLLNVKFDKKNFKEFIENLFKEILRS